MIRSKEPDSTANHPVKSLEWYKNMVMKRRIILFGQYRGAKCLILHRIAWLLTANHGI